MKRLRAGLGLAAADSRDVVVVKEERVSEDEGSSLLPASSSSSSLVSLEMALAPLIMIATDSSVAQLCRRVRPVLEREGIRVFKRQGQDRIANDDYTWQVQGLCRARQARRHGGPRAAPPPPPRRAAPVADSERGPLLLRAAAARGKRGGIAAQLFRSCGPLAAALPPRRAASESAGGVWEPRPPPHCRAALESDGDGRPLRRARRQHRAAPARGKRGGAAAPPATAAATLSLQLLLQPVTATLDKGNATAVSPVTTNVTSGRAGSSGAGCPSW